jgi:hypothetical protein
VLTSTPEPEVPGSNKKRKSPASLSIIQTPAKRSRSSEDKNMNSDWERKAEIITSDGKKKGQSPKSDWEKKGQLPNFAGRKKTQSPISAGKKKAQSPNVPALRNIHPLFSLITFQKAARVGNKYV